MIKKTIEFVMDILETIVFVGSLFIVIYLFILQPNQIRGASMEPTFDSGDYIFTSKITYRFRKPERGDIVVFRSPRNPDIEFIKRIIGLPGDSVRISAEDIYINGRLLQENYISAKTPLWEGGFIKDNEEVIIPAEKVFVMGDNRPRSSDSREFGFVDVDSIIGQVFYRYFPSDKIGALKNPYPAEFRTSRMIYISKLSIPQASL